MITSKFLLKIVSYISVKVDNLILGKTQLLEQ